MQLAIANGSIKASDESMHPGSAIAVEVCVTPQRFIAASTALKRLRVL